MKFHAILIFWINKPFNKREFAVRSCAYGQGDIILYFIVRIILELRWIKELIFSPRPRPLHPPTKIASSKEQMNIHVCNIFRIIISY